MHCFMVSVNLARNRPASQSTLDDAYKAVDGNKNPSYFRGSCTHTNHYIDISPWWRVDLGRMYLITKVEKTNRDLCKQLLIMTLYTFIIALFLSGRDDSISTKKDP